MSVWLSSLNVLCGFREASIPVGAEGVCVVSVLNSKAVLLLPNQNKNGAHILGTKLN